MMTPEKNVPYAFVMMMEDGSIMKMISIGATSMEAVDGMNIIFVKFLNLQILERAPEDLDTMDMEPIEGRWMPEDQESQMVENSGTEPSEEDEEMEDSEEEELEESVSWTKEMGSRGSSDNSDSTMILESQRGRKRRRSFDIQSLSEEEEEEESTERRRIEEIGGWSDDDAEEKTSLTS